MAAQHKIHPEQFKLFMSGEEWKQSVTDSVDRPFTANKTMGGVWKEKLSESKLSSRSSTHGAGIHDALSTRGYQHNTDDPPTIFMGSSGERIQGEGHHRIAAAADIERTTGNQVWIPTNYRKHPFR